MKFSWGVHVTKEQHLYNTVHNSTKAQTDTPTKSLRQSMAYYNTKLHVATHCDLGALVAQRCRNLLYETTVFQLYVIFLQLPLPVTPTLSKPDPAELHLVEDDEEEEEESEGRSWRR